MRLIKLSLAAALAVTVVHAEMSDIGVSANMAMTSNYVWRGMTQSHNSPAIQGGVDLDYNGFYLGTWGSNIDFGTDASLEADLYAGYAGEIEGIGFDIGAIQYMYPNDTDASNFAEAYAKLSYDFEVVAINGMYYVGIETNDLEPENGYELGVSAPVPWSMSADATYGDYDKTGEYYSIGLTKTFGKFDFNVAYTGMEYDDADMKDEDNIIVTVGTSF